ncbi:filamentous hemagglutinin N-terminal domain-containing protein, partial [Yersinia enterocolitica]
MAEFSNTRTRIASWLLIYLTAVQPLHPAIAAGIQADNRQTKVHIRGQIPVVDIVAPNAAGISHNRYRDFNVATAGAVLNNATTTGNSALVGRLAANPHLTRNSAQLIINEVTGHQSSVLEGQLEVFGQKADMIIANPNGLYCNGCNFSNASGITLTTGRPVFNSQGELDSLNITKNTDIVVGSKGVNALNQNNTAIITGGLKLHGEIRANQLDVILGTNQVNYQSGDIQSLLSKETKPLIVLDTKELGGMYANSIRLISTEKANTVNAKNIVSHKGDIRFDVAGDLNLGNITAKNNLNMTSKRTSLAKGDKLLSGRDITLVNTEFNNLGQVTAEGDLRIFSDQVRNSGQQAHIIANNNMWIQKDADGNKNTLVENKSGTIKTKNGDLIIRTEKLENSRQIFNQEWSQLAPDSTSASIFNYNEYFQPYTKEVTLSESQRPYDFPEKWFDTTDFRVIHEFAYWHLYKVNTERRIYQLAEVTPAAIIHSGNNLYVNASQLNNSNSKISAKQDIFLTGKDFLNNSHSNWIVNEFVDYEVQQGMNNYSIAMQNNWYTQWTETEKHPGKMTAGGNVVLDFTNSINFQTALPETPHNWGNSFLLQEPTQPVVQGDNILLHANSIASDELIQTRADITIIADDAINLNNSTLRGRNISLTALNDIYAVQGEIAGRDVLLLSRQGDIKFEPNYLRGYYLQPDNTRIISQINATGDFTAIAGKDINLADTLLHPANNISLSANNDINITRNKGFLGEANEGKVSTREKNIANYHHLLSLPGGLKSHQDITFNAGNSLRLQGITLEAGQEINLHAAQDIDLTLRDISYQLDALPGEDFSHPEDDYQYFFRAIRPADLSTRINAKGNLLINAGRDILTHASHIATDNNMTLLAGRNIQLAAQLYAGEGQRQDKHEVTQLQAGKALNMVASDQLLAYGAELTSAGDMTLTSGGNMRFESLLNEQHQGGGDNFSYNKLQQPTQLNSGGILTLIANGSILFQATQLMAKKVMDIAAKGGYLFAQAMEETSHSEQRWNTRKWWGRKKSHHNVHHVATNKVTEFTAEGDISLLSRDDSTYQASKIAAGQNAKLTSTHGKVIFEAVKDITFQQKTELSKGFYIKYTDKGYLDEKWVLPTIHTGGELTDDAAQGIRADVKVKNGESLRSAITALSKTPGNEWLNDLNLRDDVQWQKVMDAYHSWDHKNEQLNPVVAVVIAIAIAAATAGSGLVVAA